MASASSRRPRASSRRPRTKTVLLPRLARPAGDRIPRGEEVHVITLRANAEIPANPKYTQSMMQVFSGSTRVVIVHFKVAHEDAAQA
jgi:hypothetical protein